MWCVCEGSVARYVCVCTCRTPLPSAAVSVPSSPARGAESGGVFRPPAEEGAYMYMQLCNAHATMVTYHLCSAVMVLGILKVLFQFLYHCTVVLCFQFIL